MRSRTSCVSLVSGLIALCTLAAAAQQPSVLPMAPFRERGASVTPAFEGWYKNDDGSFSMLVGYYNRNGQQELDIPIGPNNRIEPGGPDLGQPTHFLTGRQWGMFTIAVPKDFKPDDKFVWTIVANGQTTQNTNVSVDPFEAL